MVKKKSNKKQAKEVLDILSSLVKYGEFHNKSSIKMLYLLYMFIVLLLFLTLFMYIKSLLENNFSYLQIFKREQNYLYYFLVFVICYIFFAILSNPLRYFLKDNMYFNPKITFFIFLIMALYIIYNTYLKKL
jgi:hypothetical protein